MRLAPATPTVMAAAVVGSRRAQHRLGEFPGDAFGLYDMLGNIEQWTRRLLEA